MKREAVVLEAGDLSLQQGYIDKIRNFNEEKSKYTGGRPLFCPVTWGCQMNEHDTENIIAMTQQMGYELCETEKDADLILYNTCAVRENAELKVYGNLHLLKKYKEQNPNLIIAVCGCMMQQPHIVEEMRRKYPHVSLVFGTHNIYQFPQLLNAVMEDPRSSVIDVWDIDGQVVEGLPSIQKFATKAFVNIMYGCDNFCSYCIVPYTRGRERSRRVEDIKNEVKALAEAGIKEITLLGQNVNSFGLSGEERSSFPQLLRVLDQVDGIERIRFMTSHPKDISEELIDAMATLPKVCQSLHLPVQAGSTKVLREMNRHYSKEEYLDLVKRIRNRIPDMALTTDIMVGFPGETEEDFLDTLDVVKKVGFDSAFTFLYSPRKGTAAAKREDQIPETVKKERFDRLLQLVNQDSARINQSYQGKTVEVLVEGEDKRKEGYMMGRNRQGKLVHFKGTVDAIGKLVSVRITEPKSFSLSGEEV